MGSPVDSAGESSAQLPEAVHGLLSASCMCLEQPCCLAVENYTDTAVSLLPDGVTALLGLKLYMLRWLLAA